MPLIKPNLQISTFSIQINDNKFQMGKILRQWLIFSESSHSENGRNEDNEDIKAALK